MKDACSNRIVGYSMSDRMTADLAVRALRHAVALPGPAGTVVHSRPRKVLGWKTPAEVLDEQLRSRHQAGCCNDRLSPGNSARTSTSALRDAQLHGSMGRVGACADNAAMESFFSLLQKNVLDRRRWSTRQDLRAAIVFWSESTYHRRRRQDGLGRLTPVEYETLLQPLLAA